MSRFVSTYGYGGAFLISLFGNFTIFFPVPFVITIYALGATLNPMILGLVCGVGSAIGELSAYLLGRGGRRVIDDKYGPRLENVKLLIQRYGVAIIFLFAVLPLPDDLILIPLGMLRYNLKKAMATMLIGKTLMCIGVAYAGKYSYTLIKDIFANSVLGGILSIALLFIIISIMLKVDWSRFVQLDEENLEQISN
jgi:membrane protein YqaA with SNARE-associated domain